MTPGDTSRADVVYHASTSNSISFVVEWSARTSSSPARAGPDSDLFLLVTTPLYFVDTLRVNADPGSCSGNITMEPVSVVYGAPALQFVERWDAEQRVEQALREHSWASMVPDWSAALGKKPRFSNQPIFGGFGPPTSQPSVAPLDLTSAFRPYMNPKHDSLANSFGAPNADNPAFKDVAKGKHPMGGRRVLSSDGRPFDPLAAADEPLWGDAAVSTAFSQARTDLKGVPPVVVFRGGGSEVSFGMSESDAQQNGGEHKSTTQTIDIADALSGDFQLVVASGSVSFSVSRSWMGTHDVTMGAKDSSSTASAGFSLSDPDPGDVFEVTVQRDLAYGTFWFNTTHGYSKCPVEPHTVPREFRS